MTDVPQTQHPKLAERGRLVTHGRRTDDGSSATLLVIGEHDGSWTFQLPGSPGVRLTADLTLTLARAIVERAQ